MERQLEEAATAEREAAAELREAEHVIAVEEAVAKRRLGFGELHRFLSATVRVIMSTAGIAIVLLVLSQIVLDTFFPTIDIKPVSVPADLEKAGYKADVVSLMLADELDRIEKAASTGHRRPTLYFNRPPLDLTMPGLGFSVSSISSYVKSFLSLEQSIVCDITADTDGYTMNIRDRRTSRSQTEVTIKNKDLDALINDGAKEILRLSDPYVLASFEKSSDPAQAKMLLRDVIDRGDAEDVVWGYTMWGIITKTGGDVDGGIRYYRMAVDAYHAIPWYRRWFMSDAALSTVYTDLSIAYHQKNEMPISTRYMRKAADMGFEGAESFLGERYLKGEGVARDPRTAAMWFHRAAAKGFLDADYQLALLNLDGTGAAGDGVAPNPREGIAELRYAAAHGWVPAEERFGEEYLSGKNLPRDAGEAKYWLGLAAEKGNADAKRQLEALTQQSGCTGSC
jgi:TPR repeat protein